MANSAGGRIIYGISAGPINSWLPGELEPVERSSITTETLHQIISSRIQPRIEGVNIYAVPITEGKALYVVDIPQSTTAHQASDKRYHKRVNNISQPMEDYEIRDVMNHKSAINLSLRIIPDLTRDQVRAESTITMNCGMHFLVSVTRALNRYTAWAAIRKRAKAAGFLTPVGMSRLAGNRHDDLPRERWTARARPADGWP
jgi:Schlafen, AlbA_2